MSEAFTVEFCADYLGVAASGADNWKSLAHCRGLDPALFYPERGELVREAKQVCSGCPVRAECLAFSLNTADRLGVWGGLSPRERRRLRVGAPAPARPRPVLVAGHGSESGYRRHRSDGEDACPDCLAAHAVYKAKDLARRRAELRRKYGRGAA